MSRTYSIDADIFSAVPAYRRAVLVARGVRNAPSNAVRERRKLSLSPTAASGMQLSARPHRTCERERAHIVRCAVRATLEPWGVLRPMHP